MATKEYKLIEAGSRSQLNDLVNQHLNAGWKCQGSASASDVTGILGGKSTIYVQAVIREAKKMTVNKIRIFRLYWLTGDTQEVSAPDVGSQHETLAIAMNNAGIGNGALRALDYWREITPKEESEIDE